jgi:DNA-binding SARP family transcriptional activator
VRRDGELVAVPAPKQRALLGLLLLHANEPVSQDELIDQLWGEHAPRTARASLQNLVYALRRVIGQETLERQPGGYVLHVEPGELDLERFEQLVSDARRAGPKERAASLREALELWRGPPLVEFPVEPFLQFEIARLEEERLTALEDRVDAELELGLHEELVAELGSLVEHFPTRERIWGQLMLALYRSGRQAEALETYRRAHQTLLDGLGLEPGVDLRELQRAILIQDRALDDPQRKLGSAIERATSILPRSPSERAESLYDYAISVMRLGERRQALSMFEAAERLASAVGDRSVEERARLYRSYLSIWLDGKSPQDHLAETQRAAADFAKREDKAGLALALRQQSQMLAWSGHAEDGVAIATAAVEIASRLGSPQLEASFRAVLPGFIAAGPMPVQQAILRCRAELVPDLPNEPRQRLWVLCALVPLEAQAGRIEVARELGAEAVELSRSAGLVGQLVDAMHACGLAECILGSYTSAIGHFRAARAILATEVDHAQLPDLSAQLACALASAGEVAEARGLALEARASAAPDLFATEVLWRRALALVASHDGRFDEAMQLADEARKRAAASDWLTFRGATLEDAAVVCRLAGDLEGESTDLDEALELYERKGNIVGAERVRRQLAQR